MKLLSADARQAGAVRRAARRVTLAGACLVAQVSSVSPFNRLTSRASRLSISKVRTCPVVGICSSSQSSSRAICDAPGTLPLAPTPPAVVKDTWNRRAEALIS